MVFQDLICKSIKKSLGTLQRKEVVSMRAILLDENDILANDEMNNDVTLCISLCACCCCM